MDDGLRTTDKLVASALASKRNALRSTLTGSPARDYNNVLLVANRVGEYNSAWSRLPVESFDLVRDDQAGYLVRPEECAKWF